MHIFFIKYDKKYVTIKKKKITKNKNYNDSKQNINLLYNRNELHEKCIFVKKMI